jgi:hypothetical protein
MRALRSLQLPQPPTRLDSLLSDGQRHQRHPRRNFHPRPTERSTCRAARVAAVHPYVGARRATINRRGVRPMRVVRPPVPKTSGAAGRRSGLQLGCSLFRRRSVRFPCEDRPADTIGTVSSGLGSFVSQASKTASTDAEVLPTEGLGTALLTGSD